MCEVIAINKLVSLYDKGLYRYIIYGFSNIKDIQDYMISNKIHNETGIIIKHIEYKTKTPYFSIISNYHIPDCIIIKNEINNINFIKYCKSLIKSDVLIF